MKHVAIVILNWNGRQMLQKFLPSVLKYSLLDSEGEAGWRAPHHSTPIHLTSEVIVADNGSTDDSVAFLRENYPDLRIIELDRNYGFAGGYNRALEQVKAKYYVLLNSDVECTPHWIQPVINMMEHNRKWAVAQPKMLMYDRRNTFEYAGAAGGFIDSLGYPFCRGRLFSTFENDHGQYDTEENIFWASGAAMFVRARVWNKLGGLDEDFFAHMEEIDFCWRAKNAGYTVRYCPKSQVFHVGGGTLPKSSPMKTMLNFRNNLSMLYKNLPEKKLKKTIRLRLLLDNLAALKFLFEGKVAEFHAVYTAHREFKALIPDLELKRQQQTQEQVSGIYTGMLLIEYYLLRRHIFTSLRGRFIRHKRTEKGKKQSVEQEVSEESSENQD